MSELTSAWCVFDAAGEMTCTPLVVMYWALLVGFFGLAVIIWAILSADDQYAPVRDWLLLRAKKAACILKEILQRKVDQSERT